MTNLFFLPYKMLIFLVILLVSSIILQTGSLVYDFFGFRYRKAKIWRSLLNLAILGELFLLLYFVSDTIYQINEHIAVFRPNNHIRFLFFILLTILSIGTFIKEKYYFSLIFPVISLFTLPFLEVLLKEKWVYLPAVPIILWFISLVVEWFYYKKEKKEKLSAFSVKEAVDKMDFGLLYCKIGGKSDGEILLCNRTMQNIMVELQGKIVYNGRAFYNCLLEGKVSPRCHRRENESDMTYTLEDGSAWRFRIQILEVRKQRCALLIASDTTEQINIGDRLYKQNEALSKRNEELKALLENVESLSETEETLRTKGRVHDILGQRISLILRSVREHREPDEALLAPFIDGFPEELKNSSVVSEEFLQKIAKSFAHIGVSVVVKGTLPKNENIKKAFCDVITEAVTNAVHHGYASEIQLCMAREGHFETINITDNGLAKEEKISEGGGLSQIRRSIEKMGGEFRYTLKPHFSINIKVPDGEV